MSITRLYLGILFLILLISSGCAKAVSTPSSALGEAVAAEQSVPSPFRPDRMLIWKANLGIEVSDVNGAIGKATAIADQNGGYVEWKSEFTEQSAQVRLRVPIRHFNNAVSSFEGLGEVTSRSITGEDVTEKYIDIEARLKNKYALRDRLKQLLEKAVNVNDILAIETELNRVQSDIDSMEGKIKSLKGQVDFATVDLCFHKEKILGPLGYVFKGLWWGVKKLFVISD